MHAFSGLAGTQALEGLDKENCLRRGWQGGVVRLVYVTAYMFGEGWCQVPPGTADGMVSLFDSVFPARKDSGGFDFWCYRSEADMEAGSKYTR